MRRSAFAGTSFLLFGLGLPAVASPRLPGEVRQDLGLSYTPQCSLCHIRGNTGAGTEIQPFVLSAKGFGFGGQQDTLRTALLQMADAGTDSDSDGIPDITELLQGTDPNVYGPVPFSTESDPSYGCASVGASGAALLGGLGLWIFLARSRRARRQS
jgi:hypothetical protein